MTANTKFITDNTTPRMLTVKEADEILREHFPGAEDRVEESSMFAHMHIYTLQNGDTIEIEWGKQRLIKPDMTGWEFTMDGCYTIDMNKAEDFDRTLIYKFSK